MKVFIGTILFVGIFRLVLTLSEVPNAITRYASMSAVILIGIVYYGVMRITWRERIHAAYLLILPYMAIELVALGYAWATGRETIFHAPEYSFNTTIPLHFVGHLIGGLTWEPLMIFVPMQLLGLLKTRLDRSTAH